MANKRLNVLVLSHISEMLGGAERSMLDVFDYWAKHYNVKPEFILREPVKSMAGELKRRGWKFYSMPFTFWSDGNPPKRADDIYRNWQNNLAAVQKIEKIIQKTKPQIVFTNSVVSPWAALAAYRQKVPHIWFVREYGDLDHGRTYEIGRKKTLEDVGNLSALVVTNSRTLAKHVSKYVDNTKVKPLYNPFNLDLIRSRADEFKASPFKDKSSLKLILTGNLAASKGQLEAVQATANLNQAGFKTELCLVGRSGDPDFSQQINKIIQDNQLQDKVHLVGYQTNPLPYIKAADVGIMPSRMEAFGRVTFEYLVLGKPVVGSNSGATPEMVKPGVNGYLFEPGDVASLVAALKHYAQAPDLKNQQAAASRELAETMMAGEDNVDALFQAVSQVLQQPHRLDRPIHFLKYWDDYAQTVKDRAPQIADRRLTNRAHRYLYRKAKAGYIKARSLKAKMTGR